MSREEYDIYYKQATKAFRQCVLRGDYPYVPVLEHLTKDVALKREVYMGLMDIPLERVVGTLTEGRARSFARGFLPLLKPGTEFAEKWTNLFEAHMNEGIHDPIKVYEYMNKFYVVEGNKRASVLKACDAVSVAAEVYRVTPEYDPDNREICIYYEFMKFYDLTGLNSVWFSREGSYRELVDETGYSPFERWDDDQILMIRSLVNRFDLVYEECGGSKLNITSSDALLKLIQVYSYGELCDAPTSELKKKVQKIWDELESMDAGEADLKLDPERKTAGVLSLKGLRPTSVKKLTVGFIYEKTPETSAWTYSHDLGRSHLQNVYPDMKIHTYCNTEGGQGNGLIARAIADGCNVIFATSPRFMEEAVRLAVEHPEVTILDCSLNTSYKSVRTYYGRMYEAKFLAGMVAGAMCDDPEIGYMADYPLYGMIANINAFALGVSLVNPSAKVRLLWTKLKDQTGVAEAYENLNYISGQDLITPASDRREFGLFRKNNGVPENLIASVWDWGQIYVRIVDSIRYGGWEQAEEKKAINYWWGLGADAVKVIESSKVPAGVSRLVKIMEDNIRSGNLHVFAGDMKAQDGREISRKNSGIMMPSEIMKMDWLLDNVEGYIPRIEELTDDARGVVQIQGVAGTKATD